MVRRLGVRAELVEEPGDDSIELVLQVFADLDGGRRVVAHADEPPRLILGLRNVGREQRLAFIGLHLREAYLDPVAGDPMAWQALIATLGDDGLNYGVADLRELPFTVELDRWLTAALG
jgi:hypothetical protein